MKKNAELQKEWATQQMREKKAANDNEREEEKCYAEQTDAILRMRGMLEDENLQRQADHAKWIQAENKRLAREKREREERARCENEAMNQSETTLTRHPEELQMDGTIRRNLRGEP